MINGSAVRTGVYFRWNDQLLTRYLQRWREIADIPTRHFMRLVNLIGQTLARARLRHASG
jgi:hypothetical protein